jgi:hypothetical protein
MSEEVDQERETSRADQLRDSIFQKRLQIEMLMRGDNPTALKAAVRELQALLAASTPRD